jgi:transposase
LSIIVTGANANDGKRIDEVLSTIVVKRKLTPQRRSKHLCADAGYRSAECQSIIDAHGYIAHVVDRKQEADVKRRHPEKKAHRWVVEVCHSWFNRFRKLAGPI